MKGVDVERGLRFLDLVRDDDDLNIAECLWNFLAGYGKISVIDDKSKSHFKTAWISVYPKTKETVMIINFED